MKKLFVLLVIACMATASFGGNGDPIVKSNSKSSVKGGITMGSGGVQSNSKSSVKTNYKSNNDFKKRRYHKILRTYRRNYLLNKIF